MLIESRRLICRSSQQASSLDFAWGLSLRFSHLHWGSNWDSNPLWYCCAVDVVATQGQVIWLCSRSTKIPVVEVFREYLFWDIPVVPSVVLLPITTRWIAFCPTLYCTCCNLARGYSCWNLGDYQNSLWDDSCSWITVDVAIVQLV